MAHLKVLVKGSILGKEDYEKQTPPPDIPYEVHQKMFIAACSAIGRALASRGHTIMVGVPQWRNLAAGNVVANYVLDGAYDYRMKEKTKGGEVIFYSPKEPEPADKTPEITDSLQDFRKKLEEAGFTFEDRFLGKGPWSASMIPDVEEADVVILVGGGEGTATIGYSAYSMNKPVVAVTGFGGAAKILTDELLSNQYDYYTGKGSITQTEIRALWTSWSEDSSNEANSVAGGIIIRVAEKLVDAYQQGRRISRTLLYSTVSIVVLSIALWVFFFLAKTIISNDLIIFILLYLSALTGTGLRNLVGLQRGEVTRIHLFRLVLDLGISIVVAFGLALIYLIGGISFTGKVVILNTGQNDTFSTIAVSMSLLGLAAGYLQPLQQLQDRLEQAIEPKAPPGGETPA